MGRVFLCAGKSASVPFYIKNMDVRIYSIEELCYCIGEHTFLVDESMMDKALIDWIITECKMEELGLMLRRLMENHASFGLFFVRLLYYVGYHEPEEVERIGKYLDSSEEVDPIQRRKNVADYLAQTKRYEAALRHYHMLYYDLPPTTEDSLRGAIIHNIGVVNARLFRFREASRMFKKAYELGSLRQSKEQYLSAVRLWYTMEDEDGRFGLSRFMELVARGGESMSGISLEIEHKMEDIKAAWEESETNHLLTGDLQDAEGNDKAVLSVLMDEAERIRNGYRQMIRE